MNGVGVEACDPTSPAAQAMGEALWGEIQQRYGFTAPNPFDPAGFTGPVGRFWVAMEGGDPVGSVALAPLDAGTAELDVMYVVPRARGSGVAQALLAALEEHTLANGISTIVLRAGEPQPEALRFYAAAGFSPVAPYGRWVGDESARCFIKRLVESQ